MTAKITKDMLIGEVVEKHPVAAQIMMEKGLHCIGCHVAHYETIEQGCLSHGITEEEIDKMVEEINNAVEGENKEEQSSKESSPDPDKV